MKAAFGGVGAAFAASLCCIGPVAMTVIGAGAVGASAVKLEPCRPWLMGMTVVLIKSGFKAEPVPVVDKK